MSCFLPNCSALTTNATVRLIYVHKHSRTLYARLFRYADNTCQWDQFIAVLILWQWKQSRILPRILFSDFEDGMTCAVLCCIDVQGCQDSKLQAERIAALQERKQALEALLNTRVGELKQVCLQEAVSSSCFTPQASMFQGLTFSTASFMRIVNHATAHMCRITHRSVRAQ